MSGHSRPRVNDLRSVPRDAAAVLLSLIAIAPAVFLFVAVQYSALTFPFWDHCEIVSYFAKVHDHTLRLPELWAPHNHSRPLTYRTLVLANGLLTNWDIRSEYIFLLASIYGAFLCQAVVLRTLTRDRTKTKFLLLLCVLSVVSFSPASHNDHWWSFMIQLDLAHLFMVAGLLLLSTRPLAWTNNILSALAFWLATYTLSNGLVAFVAALLVIQIASRSMIAFNRFTAFWLVNLVLVLSFYLPGLPVYSQHAPGLLPALLFVLAYLGSPLRSLFGFPFRGQFDIPENTTWSNAAVGLILCISIAIAAYLMRRELRNRAAPALSFLSFALVAVGSAILTAWGRAEFDAAGVANANASRFTIFSSYLIYALIYAATLPWSLRFPVIRVRNGITWPKTVLTVFVTGFFLASARSYAQSVVVYRQAHEFNDVLAAAYLNDDPDAERSVYPNADRVKQIKLELRRLRIGPYRNTFAGGDSSVLQQLAENKLVDEFNIDGLRYIRGLGQVLFAHPHARFFLPLTGTESQIRLHFGFLDQVMNVSPQTEGVQFRILLEQGEESKTLFVKTLRPFASATDRGPHEASVQLNEENRSGKLIFETLAVGRSEGTWCYWGDADVR